MATATFPDRSPSNAAAPDAPATRRANSFRFLAAPALFGACGFSAGILCAHYFWMTPGILLVALLMLFAVTAIALRIAPRLAWPATGLLLVLLGALCAEIAPAVNQQKQLALLADGGARTVEGEVMRAGPVRTVMSATPFSTKTHEEGSQQMDLRLNSPADSTVRVTIYAPAEEAFPQIRCGDAVRATLTMHGEERFLDPGAWDAGAYLLRQGIGALGSAKAEKLAVVATAKTQTFACRLHSLQVAAGSSLIDFAEREAGYRLPAFLRLDHDDAAMLTAMLTGDRSYLQRGVRVGFERTGSFHLLVVSGLHLAIFSGLIFWVTRRLGLSRVWASLVTIVCSLGYAVFTGFGNPVQRAFWMVTLYLIGRLLWRERVALNVIGVRRTGDAGCGSFVAVRFRIADDASVGAGGCRHRGAGRGEDVRTISEGDAQSASAEDRSFPAAAGCAISRESPNGGAVSASGHGTLCRVDGVAVCGPVGAAGGGVAGGFVRHRVVDDVADGGLFSPGHAVGAPGESADCAVPGRAATVARSSHSRQ